MSLGSLHGKCVVEGNTFFFSKVHLVERKYALAGNPAALKSSMILGTFAMSGNIQLYVCIVQG